METDPDPEDLKCMRRIRLLRKYLLEMRIQISTYANSIDFDYFSRYVNALNAPFKIDRNSFGVNFEANISKFLKQVDEYCQLTDEGLNPNVAKIDALVDALQ